MHMINSFAQCNLLMTLLYGFYVAIIKKLRVMKDGLKSQTQILKAYYDVMTTYFYPI